MRAHLSHLKISQDPAADVGHDFDRGEREGLDCVRGDAGWHQAHDKAGAQHDHPARDSIGDGAGQGQRTSIIVVRRSLLWCDASERRGAAIGLGETLETRLFLMNSGALGT